MSENYRYLVVDIESKGQHQTLNDMLCFGACIGNSLTGEIEDEFEVYIRHRYGADHGWEQRCLDEFWNKEENKKVKDEMLRRIETEGLYANDAMKKFYDWINNRSPEYLKSLVIITDTAGFDIGFMNHYLSNANLPSMSYIIGNSYKPPRDSSSFHMGVGLQLPVDGLWEAEKAATKKLGISLDKNPYSHDHNPKNDAKSLCWEIMQIHKAILSLRNS